MARIDRPGESLSEAVFQILLALSDQPRHGLGIAADVESRSGGRVTLGAGTLYTALRRLRDDGWTRDAPAPAGRDDPRRRFYALTTEGRRIMDAEARRLDALVRDRRVRSILRGKGPA
jgi:DNA-binding PadR family transcriptional regulator